MPSPGNFEQGRIFPVIPRAARQTDARPWPIPPRATQPRKTQARPVQSRVSQSLPAPTKPRAHKNYRNIKHLPLDMLTKDEKKKEWKRVVKVSSRLLACSCLPATDLKCCSLIGWSSISRGRTRACGRSTYGKGIRNA